MPNIAIVGAGQLGSRHLQAMALLTGPVRIWVVDPSTASLATARERWNQVAGVDRGTQVTYRTDMRELPAELDVAIIATNADTRRSAIEQLMVGRAVRHLILEKVLFQSIGDVDDVERMLERSSTKAWVNCPRRMWSFYRDLKTRLGPGELLDVSAKGSSWGLACNAIHFLDLVAWYRGSPDVALFGDELDDTIIDATRPGFIELTGCLRGRWACGARVDLASWAIDAAPFVLEVRSRDLIAVIREDEGKAWTAERANGWAWTQESLEQERQSQLSHRVVMSLASNGHCELTPYRDAAILHRAMLGTFLGHLHRQPRFAGTKACPIT